MSTSGIAAALIITLATGMAARGTVGQQTAIDIDGWMGAKWGMTPEQVAAATQLTLGTPVPRPKFRGGTLDATLRCVDVPAVTVGQWAAKVSFCFDGGSELKGLHWIQVDLGNRADFTEVRNQLKSKYGDPVSDEPSTGKTGAIAARWLLPSTEVRCIEMTFLGDSTVAVEYSKRKKTPF